MSALALINQFEKGDTSVLKEAIWLRHIVLTERQRLNLERVDQISQEKHFVLQYVKKTLTLLDAFRDKPYFHLLESVLKWSEVAKTGMRHQRKIWHLAGFNLAAHNIGSAQIYQSLYGNTQEEDRLIIDLIKTHGLVGQTIRGEVPMEANLVLREWFDTGIYDRNTWKELLLTLNYTIIGGVSLDLWQQIKLPVEMIIENLVDGVALQGYSPKERLKRMRRGAILAGEDFEGVYEQICQAEPVRDALETFIKPIETWYFEGGLNDFNLVEVVKLLLLIRQKQIEGVQTSISFERLMTELYYDRFGKKKVNLYKKRMIEHFLGSLAIEDLVRGKGVDNSIHLDLASVTEGTMTYYWFEFSKAAGKLIEYCQEAEAADSQYEKAIIMLFDLFGLRKDAYDRFYEEERYLETMNSSIDYKKVILEYITGDSVIDIGPGGGALMDLIEDSHKCEKIIGVDIAQNVLDALNKRKQRDGRSWTVQYGDALDLSKYFEPGSITTVIFCSILHELFSYIPFNDKKFNHDTLAVALKSAYELLPVGGRIIIRDGIMTEPVDQYRIIAFRTKEGLDFLNRYQQDFKGREIKYELIGLNTVKMLVNDAMEFLYTYTWGEESYVHEVNEQFGYFTPSDYKKFIRTHLGDTAIIIHEDHYLQPGYDVYLSKEIGFYNENHEKVALPDSTCLIVIEKGTKCRCGWAGSDSDYQKYHDEEWGVPSYDDRHLFEMLCLEGAQAGLSWITILKKRSHYRRLFKDFDPLAVAELTDETLEAFLLDPGIIRNRLKVFGFRKNAQAFLKVVEEFGSFSQYIWGFVDYKIEKSYQNTYSELPTSTPASDRMSKDLKKRGFTFVGSTICYAYMQAVGMVDDHTIDCYKRL